MDTSVPPGKYISNYDNHKTFNRAWGGYTGRHEFPWHNEYSLLADKAIEEWRALGVEYAIMPQTPLLDDPDEIMLGREFALSLPPDLAPGEYQLVSGLYDPETWQRLQSPGGDDRLVIAQISVQAPVP